jgi:hypothetical protein
MSDLVDVIPILGTLVIIGALFAGMRLGARALPGRSRTIGISTATTALLVCASAAFTLAIRGVFDAQQRIPIPPIAYGLLLPLVIFGALLGVSDTARRLCDAIPQTFLIAVQTYRLLGGVFLLLMMQGRMPGAFAMPAGWGDILIGASAPFVALAYRRDPSRSRSLVLLWNLLGVLDLVIAVTMGMLTAPGHLQRFGFDHPNFAIRQFPFVLIPVFLVPISLFLHVLSLGRKEQASYREEWSPR